MTDLTAAVARAVSELHEPMPTALGVDACAHCTALRQVHIIRWPCPTRKVADQAATEGAAALREQLARQIEALAPDLTEWRSDYHDGRAHMATEAARTVRGGEQS